MVAIFISSNSIVTVYQTQLYGLASWVARIWNSALPLTTFYAQISNKSVKFSDGISSEHVNWKLFIRRLFLKYKCIYFNWRLITLQYCVGFAIHQHVSATGIHVFPIPLVVPVHQPQASSILYRTWTGDSFHIWYYTCFSAILQNHPTLSLSHRVQKNVLYICVPFAVSHTGLSLPSF